MPALFALVGEQGRSAQPGRRPAPARDCARDALESTHHLTALLGLVGEPSERHENHPFGRDCLEGADRVPERALQEAALFELTGGAITHGALPKQPSAESARRS